MELDEIKNAWNDMNKRLEQAESLNKRMIEDMLDSRQQSAKEKLMKYEVFFLVMCFACVPFFTLFLYAGIYPFGLTMLFNSLMILAGIWQIYKIYLLRQMDINTCSTSELLNKAIRFKVITRLRTIVGMALLLPLIAIMFILDARLLKPEIIIGMCVGAVIGLGIGLTMFFKHLKDIDSLVKSYKDLKEFKA